MHWGFSGNREARGAEVDAAQRKRERREGKREGLKVKERRRWRE